MARTSGSSAGAMTVMDHIREIRTRFFAVALIFIVVGSLAYVFRDQLIHLLLAPLNGQQLVYLTPAGGFSFIFLISIYAGLAIAVPFLFQQIYAFVRPMLPVKIRHYSVRIFVSSFLLLAAGITFGYMFAIPGALDFLYGFAEDYIQASLTADSYLNFIMAYTIGIGLVFQLPLLLMLIHWIKPLTPGGMFRSQRWVIVLAFVAAAIITPTPDPINQTIIAVPIILVYQLGVIAVLINIRNTKREAKRLAAEAATPATSLQKQVQPRAQTKPANQAPQPQPRPTLSHPAAKLSAQQIAAKSPNRPQQTHILQQFQQIQLDKQRLAQASTAKPSPIINASSAASGPMTRSLNGMDSTLRRPAPRQVNPGHRAALAGRPDPTRALEARYRQSRPVAPQYAIRRSYSIDGISPTAA